MSYDTRGLKRQPGTNEGARRTRLTEDDLKALGLQFEPGVKCPSCATPLDEHSDADCLVVLMNALKVAAKKMAQAQEKAEQLEEIASVVTLWMTSTQPDRADHYTELLDLVRERETGG